VKLRSLVEFEDAVDAETAWRKRELTTLLFQARAARGSLRATALRAGVALLYAHWEGWIKAVGTYYIDHVVQQKLSYDDLSPPFFAIALKAKISAAGEANAAHVHVALAEFLRTEINTRAKMSSAGVIRTQANLSSAVLKDITTRLGIPFKPYELHTHVIDQSLLDRRNTIAHGEYLDIDLPDFEQLHSQVTSMLTDYTTAVTNAAALKAFKV
jgi:hypothetical protein